MASIAIAIRSGLLRSRELETFNDLAPGILKHFLDLANKGDLVHVPTHKGAVTINSDIWYVTCVTAY